MDMKKTMLIYLTILLFLSSCVNSLKKGNATPDIILDTTDGRFDLYANLNEIVLFSNNTFLFYKHISFDSFMAVWGNVKYDKIQYDTLHMFPIGPPLLEWHNEDAICLRQGCGTDCFFAYILLFKTSEIKTYMYPLAYDTTNNLIVCAGNYDSKVFLVVENFLTGEKREIIEDYLPFGHSGYAIESIIFNQSGLFVKWRDSQNNLKEKVFK
jgi:hypothetical protein